MHEPGSWEISGTPGLSRFPASFPRGATFDIVCPTHPTEPEDRGSNNVKNGTSAALGPFPKSLPVRMPGTSGERGPFPKALPKIRNPKSLGGMPHDTTWFPNP